MNPRRFLDSNGAETERSRIEGAPPRWPAIAAALSPLGTRIYEDPISGEILATVDGAAQWYRWLHMGLHRLDVLPLLRSRPIRDIVMLPLLTGVTLSCGTGFRLGLRRLRRMFGKDGHA